MMEESSDFCVVCKKTESFLKRKCISITRISSEEQANSISEFMSAEVQINSILCGKCRLKCKFRREQNLFVTQSLDHATASQQLRSDSDQLASSSYTTSPAVLAEAPLEPMNIEEQPYLSASGGPDLRKRKAADNQMGADPLNSENSQSFSTNATSEASIFPSPAKPKLIPKIKTVELHFARTITIHSYCFICGHNSKVKYKARKKVELTAVPFEARLQLFTERRIYVPVNNRCCTFHLFRKRFYADQLQLVKPFMSTCRIPVSEVAQFLDVLSAKSHATLFDQFKDRMMSEERVHALTGFNWQNIEKIREMLPSMRNTTARDAIQAVIVFLFKLRSGSSYNIIAAVLQIQSEETAARYFDSVLKAFQVDVLPKSFGPTATTREFLISERSSTIANELFGINSNQLALICDGTYVSHEKSRNNAYQRQSYSGQKKKHLCKPFTICTTDGFVLDVGGPYPGTMNDAAILKDILTKPDGIARLLRPGDVFILDRGFRDAVSVLEDLEYRVLMPAFKDKRAQLTAEEANNSRYVTKVRWVVEVIHGIVSQKYKFLHGQVDNKMLPKIRNITKIVCHLNNIFGKKLVSDVENSAAILQRMKNRMTANNEFAKEVEEERWARKRVCFTKLSSSDVQDFPELTDDQLILFFTGTYQLGQAVSYLGELINEDGTIGFHQVTDRDADRVLKVEIQSRHRNSKEYKCFLQYIPNNNSLDGIKGYACQCPNGLRTIGSCSHIAAIIFYLSNARYKSRIISPNQILTDLFKPDSMVEVLTGADSDEED